MLIFTPKVILIVKILNCRKRDPRTYTGTQEEKSKLNIEI